MVEELEKILRDYKVPSFCFSGEKKGNGFVVYVGDYYAKKQLGKKKIPGITIVTDLEKYKECYFGPKDSQKNKTLEGASSSVSLYDSDILKSKICYPDMTNDRFIIHSGNAEAVKAMNYSFEKFLKGGQCDPVCILGPSGSGKSSLLSNILVRGLEKGRTSSYFGINELKGELRAKGGAEGIDISYFSGAKIVGVDSLELMPLAEDRKWTRDLVYGSLGIGFSNGALRVLAFMGDMEAYSRFTKSVPDKVLRGRLEGSTPVELEYPKKDDHRMIIEEVLMNSGFAPSDKVEFDEIVSYWDKIIPEGSSFWSIDKNYIQGPIRTAEWNQREVNIGDIQASLSYQPSLFNPNSGSPQAELDDILKEEGLDVKLIRDRGQSRKLVGDRDLVIAKLWNRGVTNLSRIAELVNRTPANIAHSLKKLGLRR